MKNLLWLVGLFIFTNIHAQEEDLLSLIEEEEQTVYTSAAFKTTRVINLQSLENTAPGIMDFKISHRFGPLNDGFYGWFGLDDATIRIGADIGLSDRLMIGFGRSSFEKTYDGFAKFKVLRQSKGKRNFPFSFSLFASTAIKTIDFADDTRDNFFSSRLYYSFQGIIGRKFSEGFTMQLSPTLIHRNLVATAEEKNDVYALGIGVRKKISKRVTINVEYIYVPKDQIREELENSLSIGFDIETGGHVFQLHFSNSTSMIEKGFVAENTGSWGDNGARFGFNIARVFNLWKVKSK